MKINKFSKVQRRALYLKWAKEYFINRHLNTEDMWWRGYGVCYRCRDFLNFKGIDFPREGGVFAGWGYKAVKYFPELKEISRDPSYWDIEKDYPLDKEFSFRATLRMNICLLAWAMTF